MRLAHNYAAALPNRLKRILDDDIAALIPQLESLLSGGDEQKGNA
jgi:hypothetical protein